MTTENGKIDKSQQQLDVRKLLCPMPVIKTQNAVNEMSPGDQLIIIASDPGTLEDIPTWSRINGHKILNIEEIDREITFLLEVGEE
ncbi:MAG: sulfurtransferase TusA family protein [Pseudomonadales bacterium]|nr:sulfurtransferase TusA family protein [Pseudomonadales bacterium]